MDNDRARILIVDDEMINIHLLAAALKHDHVIESARSGREALEKVKAFMPDLILLDVMMPNMNGFEVCKTLKAEAAYAHIPVIFLTAMDNIQGETQGLEAGAIDYLTKPVNIDLLRLRVNNHIELVRSTQIIRDQRDLLARQKEELEATLDRIKCLEGIIPICMYCKEIRDSADSWHQLEAYITDHSDATFSHGICPKCYQKEIDKLKLNAKQNNSSEHQGQPCP